MIDNTVGYLYAADKKRLTGNEPAEIDYVKEDREWMVAV